jgi:hypothetical protein
VLHTLYCNRSLTTFYISLTVHLGIILVNNKLDALFQCIYLFISLLYMFQAIQCSSSGESIVSILHLVYITLCGWLPGMTFHPDRLVINKKKFHSCATEKRVAVLTGLLVFERNFSFCSTPKGLGYFCLNSL